MPTKNFPARVKATAATDSALTEGQFTALAAVFGNIDAVGDVVMPGAFVDDLAAWKESGDTIPLYWSHRIDDPRMCIGSVLDAAESDAGLEVTAQLDLDTDIGAQVYRLLKGGRVSRMSFAYDVLDGGSATSDGQTVYELRRLKVHEVSVAQIPCNPQAAVTAVKARPRRGGAKQVPVDDPAVIAVLAQVDQAVDDADEALSDADEGMDSLLDMLGIADTDPDEPAEDAGKARRTRRKLRFKQADAATAALLGQVDQAVDAAVVAVAAADDALDAAMTALGVPDLPDEDADADDAGKHRRAARKAGRVLSAKNEGTLRAALDQNAKVGTAIKVVLDAIESDDGKASSAGPAKADEPDGAKADEPADRHESAMRRALTDIELLELDVFAELS